ncbi:sushi, von Willebrand factor type A, EGF and pentraxin domain-containing protein 1-like isoform X8 [Mercenaria mercenaria]|uniref:sushi, von Willebrand factor type A, EGF and pentraxin domain-containing protein 1-like isoform X8 n=1 Tax=Mercenaria mercenaria TaxID=6596 RepID=UPI00234E4ECF|nr:sushi, von Willebrand factor type A, EGF and pentraxin domain-containing protein 1-like isoform X8 [Mercenaria mercenaria]
MATFGLFLVLLLWRGLHKFEAAADGHIETEKLGKVTFECRKGWSIYNANCYKAIDVPMTYAFASLTCLGQGSVLYYPENELEYHDFVAGLLPKTIWFGLHKDNEDGKWKIGEIEVPLENIPRWGPKQPDQSIGNATAVHPVTEIMIYDENENLPFVCKYRACIEGYIPCDLASKCIPSEQVCNGLPECTDERDENNCSDLGKWYLHLEEEAGSFQTGSVTDFTEKTWIFEADVGKRIRLYVPQMNLQTNVVFVEVWSGGPTFESSEMLHRFTGNNSFIYLYSTTNFLIVRLYAIDVSTNTASYSFGWSTNIAQIPMGEKVETAITTWKGIPIPFISEEVKPKNLMLWWRIDAPEGQLITYYVQIDPETGYSADDVNFDIKVYGMEDSLKCRYYYTWAFNEMHVVSNFVPENGAVTLRYKLGCGMDITDTYGIIVSPHPIPNSLKCSWTLNAGQNMSPSRGMVLKFYSLMLKEDTIGTNPGTKLEDKFMIYADGSATAITDVALYDGNLDNIIHAPGGHFKVDFESDAAIMSQGFIFGFGTDCEALDVSAETIKSTNMTYFWENVELSCPIGYKFHMEKYFDMEIVTLRCDSMWEIDGEDPGAIAECQVVHCGPPTKIQNGGVKSATGVTYSEVATYFCNDGFQMSIGGPNATCDKEGMWTNVPTCTSSVCSVFNENILPNGKFEIIRGNDFSGNTADFNTVVEFSCDPGYEIVGPTISFCDSDGWTHTDNPPICKRIPCPVPSIANSNIPLAGPTSPTLSGDTYLVSCNAGYKLRSTDAGSINMFCQANKTFDQTQGCYDIDECGTNTDLCQDSPTICMNTAGSYICECKPGYKRVNDFICTDIRECDDEYGGCSTTCVEEQGSYKCVCNPGFELFESDGFNSYKLPPGETGFRRGDRYFVNHTCVRVQCPTLPQVSNGKYLTNKDSNFHFEDTITLQCADGYQVNKTGILRITFFVSTCKNDGTWDELYSCEARKCSLPAAPAYGVYDKTEVMFGEAVTLTCNLTSTKTKELKAVCIYDEKNVRFAGADISKCPEIDCGEPNLVMPVGGKFFNNIGPATNTYLPSTSKFILDCDNGFDVTGFSNDDEGNMTVRCKENGRWNFGTLACADTENPTFSGSCGQTYNIDAVDQVFFKPGTASDNVAVASFSRTDPLQSGDRLLVDTSVTYTARDFQGNDETCTVTFNVIDRTVKPTLGCPHSKTIFVSDRDSEAYNTSSEILVSGGMLQVSPASLAVSVSKIGSADNVTATAEDQFGRESSCTFMVDYVANACFKEQIFVDNNAVRACNEVGGNLVCESTCKTGYIFSDKTSAKNFTCSGTGNWDYTSTLPHARFCLLKENPEYIVSVNLIHTYGYITGDCVAEYQTFLVANIPTFQNNIENLCNQKWDVSVNTVKTDGGFFEFITTLDLKLVSSVTVSESEDCIKQIKNTANNVFDGAMFCADAGQSYSLTVKEDSVISGSGERSCSFVGYRLDVDICLPYGPAQFFNVETVAINDCPDGQYQDGFAQTSCKSCSSGQYPNSDKTGCQVTCPRGFRSNSGFYPCTACSIDTYWTAKDTCTPCPGARSTVGIEGATDETKCIEPCPKGTYSKTGYNVNGCTSCPLNFYQDETTQRTCKRCFNNQRTSATGSISFSNCTDVTDVCDRTTCNDFGDCSYKRGYRECTCDLGNYDDRCQNMYHICDGNPCTYGATCVRGATPTDYTCTCRTDLDICEMVSQAEDKVGKQGLPSQFRSVGVSSLQGCMSACLNDNECKEASFLSTFCILYNAILSANELDDESNTAHKHLRKTCNIAFGGDRCEQDTKNDCENAGCHKNSQCMDKINGFECICPSAGGYTGNLCAVANNPCSQNPCERGTCRAFGSVRYECTCPDGYEGLNCEINVDECALYPDACPYGGRCIDQIDDYTCSCSSGFSGPFCENTPNFCNNHDCNGNNVCYNSLDRMEGVCVCDTELFVPRYRCAMNFVQNENAVDQQANTVTSSVFLTTIDECKDRCQNNPDCIIATFSGLQDNTGRYICAQYNSSYTSETDSASVAIYKDCNNRPAEAYACDQEKMPCDNVDCNNGTCLNINNNLDRFCDCAEGFTGFRCQHSRDDCVGNQCENEAECIDGHLAYTCSCKLGFDGNRCENDINDCPGSCNITNGKCEDGVNGYKCICNDGYVGDTCSVEINECSSYPCEHGGTCTDEVNGFTCECLDGWEGDRCEIQINNCAGRAPCLNGGECFSLPHSARCRCEGGATGENCENATLVCDTLSNLNVCINEGVCVDGEGTATCSCPVDFQGKSCEIVKDWCAENPCKNDGTCKPVNPVGYECECMPGYSGPVCETVTDPCKSDPCRGQAKCRSSPTEYICQCDDGRVWTGTSCKKKQEI